MLQVQLPKELLNHQVLADLLFASQEFIRKAEESYSVSLHDIKRFIKLIKFFYDHLKSRPTRKKLSDEKVKPAKYPQTGKGKPSLLMRSCILALGLCYHSRLYEKELRFRYKQEIIKIFSKYVIFNLQMFDSILREEQEDYIK